MAGAAGSSRTFVEADAAAGMRSARLQHTDARADLQQATRLTARAGRGMAQRGMAAWARVPEGSR